MEKLLLSKLEVLAEWFMLLFFDPIYFQEQVTAVVIESATKEETSQQTVLSTINRTIIKRVKTSVTDTLLNKRERMYVIASKSAKIGYSKVIDGWKSVLLRRIEEIKESTLNWIQSALPIMRLNVILQ